MVRICSVDGCDLEHRAKGFCQKHYDKQYVLTEKGKEVQKKAQKKHGSSKGRKTYLKKYNSSEDGKLARKKYSLTEKGQAKMDKAMKKYLSSEKGKVNIVIARKKHFRSEKGQIAQKGYRLLKSLRRAIVLQHYSQILSKSDVPCCNCCGENSFVEFLAIDHIIGRKQMDSVPELVKIGYSSKLIAQQLIDWIIVNDFPKGFQILCHNCNMAKGVYGKCPHEK